MKRTTIHALAFGLTLAATAGQAAAQSALPPAAAPAIANTIIGPGYHVSDMARSLRFYRDVLGMTVRLQFGPKDKPESSSASAPIRASRA